MYVRSLFELIGDRPVYSTLPGNTVFQACQTMSTHNIGALPVLSDGRVIGILSERDVIRRCITGCRATETTLVAEIMTPDPVTLAPDDTAAEAIACMMETGCRHMPVCDDGRLAGMISMRDIPAENRLMVERQRDYSGLRAVYG